MINSAEIYAYMARRDRMTIRELASRLGVSVPRLTRWLAQRDMPIRFAFELAQILEIPRDEWTRIFFEEEKI